MKPTDTSEKELERIIVDGLTSQVPGYIKSSPSDYNRDHAVDWKQLLSFLQTTQPRTVEQLGIAEEGPRRLKFLARLQGEIAKRGTISVLRNGIEHYPAHIDLFYSTPSPGNAKAREYYLANIFSITRQLQYSKDETKLALDLCLFINGLPITTFELKNRLTKQTVEDAVQQYKYDREPRELLFHFGRCLVHFAVDDQEVKMCSHLQGKHSWFLPFNKGYKDGAGNPPIEGDAGIKTEYLWKEILTRDSLTDIIENYAQTIEYKDEKTGVKRRTQIFPRYHQLDVVRKLLADATQNGAGRRYLIQHSAGSGKSNSIAWLTHQLVGLEKTGTAIFDSIIVVTDRRVLDKQIKDTIKSFAQVSSTVGHADGSGDLRKFLQTGKKIVISTVQKFPFILDDIGNEHRNRTFAIIIDEAHSSQGGRVAAKMNIALSESGAEEEEETYEDIINRIIESRKMLSNASYFAFTATPKNKTLEIFGESVPVGGKIQHHPFHCYTMKQAIQEGFILDVLKHYTPIDSYVRLMKTVQDDPAFDVKKAQKKLRRYVESHSHAIRQKAEIMVDHFVEHVLARNKIAGKARAMVVTGSIMRAIQYWAAISDYLREIHSPYKALVAYSGEKDKSQMPFLGEREFDSDTISEATLNGFPSNLIPEIFRNDPYRFLVCAEKFQTGYDEPLLHTMYVDKVLSGIKAVQTLSRLNRAIPPKRDVFILDFQNDSESIKKAFEPYYRTTILSDETDPNKLNDLKSELDGLQVYSWEAVEQLVELYLTGVDRTRLDPILDACVAVYNDHLDEDAQVKFKGGAKAFCRTYSFISSILPKPSATWEKLSTFLNFLIPKLPTPAEEDLSKGILEAINMDSYRVEVRTTLDIALADEDGAVDPIPIGGSGGHPETVLEILSNIIKTFNDQFGNIDWKFKDKIEKVITEEIPEKVNEDRAYNNARLYSDRQNARIEHDKALQRVIIALMADHMELFKQYSDNPVFRKWLSDSNFELTFERDKRDSAR